MGCVPPLAAESCLSVVEDLDKNRLYHIKCSSWLVETDSSEESSMALPEELVERIIAMLPFPSIFKARGLSKSWLARFSSIRSLDDKREKRLANSFQRLVRERSIMWGPFSPVSISKELSCAYDWASKKMVRLPSLSFLPTGELDFTSKICVSGALLWIRWSPAIKYVANIFTKSWKMLPLPPNMEDILFCNSILVSSKSSETYMVIQFYQDRQLEVLDRWSAQMYDSKIETWVNKKLFEGVPIVGSPAYLNGVLYTVASFDLQNLLAINLEDRTSEKLRLASSEGIWMEGVDLVVCSGKLLMIVNALDSPEILRVLRIDLEKLQLVEVSRGPPVSINPRSFNTRQPLSHRDCILFGMQKSGSKLVYNVCKNEWTVFHFSVSLPPEHERDDEYRAISFDLGLNPFLSV